jgi:hypothetical protein
VPLVESDHLASTSADKELCSAKKLLPYESDSVNSGSWLEEESHGEDIDEQDGATPKAMTKVEKNGTSNCCGGWSI